MLPPDFRNLTFAKPFVMGRGCTSRSRIPVGVVYQSESQPTAHSTLPAAHSTLPGEDERLYRAFRLELELACHLIADGDLW